MATVFVNEVENRPVMIDLDRALKRRDVENAIEGVLTPGLDDGQKSKMLATQDN